MFAHLCGKRLLILYWLFLFCYMYSTIAAIDNESNTILYASYKDLVNKDNAISTVINSAHDNTKLTNIKSIIDKIPPIILNLSDDKFPRATKKWNWSANETSTFRHFVTKNKSFVFTDEVYDSNSSSNQITGNGVYYLYVQAKDKAGNESAVTKVSAILDSSLLPTGQYSKLGNGAWCWFGGPRAIRYHGISDNLYIGWIDKYGSIGITRCNYNTNTYNSFILHEKLEIDDHDNPSIFIRNDGRLQVFYSRHSSTGKAMYYRISTNPEDISSWGAEQVTGVNVPGKRGYTYPVPIQLSSEDNLIYLFWRGANMEPAFSTSTNGTSWNPAKTLVTSVAPYPSYMPYTKYVSNNIDEIHFAYSDSAPGITATSNIYYAYYKQGNFCKADGTFIKNIDNLPLVVPELDKVYDAVIENARSWIWDIALDSSGKPVLVYVTYPGATSGTNAPDHRYRYAYWNGTMWIDNEITPAGGPIAEDSLGATYSGGITINHSDPTIVYLSREINGQFEIQKWQTSDHGVTWKSQNITANSTNKNIRPFFPYGSTNDSDLLWESGYYYYYTKFDTYIILNSKGMIERIPPKTTISINDGAAYTRVKTVKLTLSASDDISDPSSMKMKISNYSDFNDASWKKYSDKKSWKILDKTGTNTVYCKVRDEALNESATSSDTIVYDNVSPSVEAGYFATSIKAATTPTKVSAKDQGSGIKSCLWISKSTPKKGKLVFSNSNSVNSKMSGSISDGKYSAFLKVTDNAGNVSTDIVKFIWDTTSPTIKITGSNPALVYIGDEYRDCGAKAKDNIDGNLTRSIVIVNNVNNSVLGSYTVKYTVTDSAGNTANSIRVVKVVNRPSVVDSIIDKNN